MVLLIIIPIKWLFHWEYTLFSDKPKWWFSIANCEIASFVAMPLVMAWQRRRCFWGSPLMMRRALRCTRLWGKSLDIQNSTCLAIPSKGYKWLCLKLAVSIQQMIINRWFCDVSPQFLDTQKICCSYPNMNPLWTQFVFNISEYIFPMIKP